LFFWFCLAWLLLKLILFFTNFRVRGAEHITYDKPLLLVANHLSLLDPPLLQMIIPRKLTFLAKEELFRYGLLSSFIRSRDTICVERGKNSVAVMRQAQRVLAEGRMLVIFAEGTRSKGGGLQRAYPGAASLALHSGVSILPVAISGTEKVKNILKIRRPLVEVNIGESFRLQQTGKKSSKKALREATDDIMLRVAALLPEEYRGVYSGREGNGDDFGD
jgi:1-acyl-sn-glycerol-3-phosphate acyltransferase